MTAAGDVGYVAKWNGSAWSALGSGMNDRVEALAVDGAGNLYAGGYFTTVAGIAANHIAKWNGSAWSALGNGMDYGVSALAVDGAGTLYAGAFTASQSQQVGRQHLVGSGQWDERVRGPVYALAVDGAGNLYAGGYFGTAGAWRQTASRSGTAALGLRLGSGMRDPVKALAVDGAGNIYAGGDFDFAGGVAGERHRQVGWQRLVRPGQRR